MRYRTNHLPSHGAGPLYQWGIYFGNKQRLAMRDVAVRLTYGGYGHTRSRYRPHWCYYGHAIHFGIGPVTVTLLRRGLLDMSPSAWKRYRLFEKHLVHALRRIQYSHLARRR